MDYSQQWFENAMTCAGIEDQELNDLVDRLCALIAESQSDYDNLILGADTFLKHIRYSNYQKVNLMS